MKTSTKFTIGVILVLLVGFSVFFFKGTPKDTTIGALGGPDNYLPYFGVNGVRDYFSKTALSKATTTPCAIKSPVSTSTLLSASLQVTTATTTATTWTLAKATTGFATTTPIATFSLGSGAQGTLTSVASTTGVDGLSTISPNTYVNFGVAGIGQLTSDKLLGTCQAVFRAI